MTHVYFVLVEDYFEKCKTQNYLKKKKNGKLYAMLSFDVLDTVINGCVKLSVM